MLYNIQSFVSALKAARLAKKLSQRDLASRIEVPQSHVSKIEAGKVNLTLSSFIEMARTLDLEPMLIPAQNVKLIESILASKNTKHSASEIRRAYVPDEFEEDEDA